MIKILLTFTILTQGLLAFHPVENAYKWMAQEYKDFRTYPRIDRAYKFIRVGKDAEAKALFAKVLEIDPSDRKASRPLISLCLKENDKACIRKYTDYLEEDDLAYFNLFNAQEKIRNKKYKKAIYYALEALKDDLEIKDQYFAKLILIESYIQCKKYDLASKYIDKLYYSKTTPNHDGYHSYLVNLAIEVGRMDLAEKEINKYLESGNILSDIQLWNWSHTSDNLKESAYAYYLAEKLSSSIRHLRWQIDLLSKLKRYDEASQKMELIYAKDKSTKNKNRLLYLYELAGKTEKTSLFYNELFRQECDSYALSYLLDQYKKEHRLQIQILNENKPLTCLAKKTKSELELYKRIGYIYDSSNKKKESLYYFQTYLEHYEDLKLRLYLAQSYFFFTFFSKTETMLLKYEKNNGIKSYEYYTLKAKLAKKAKHCEQAEKNYRLALNLRQEEYLAYEYTNLLRKCHKGEEAVVELMQLSQSYQKNLVYTKDLAYLNLELGHKKKAIDYAKISNVDAEWIYNVKNEIKYDTKKWDFYFTQTMRLDDYSSNNIISPLKFASYGGVGGVELSYRPKYFENHISIFTEVLYADSNISSTIQPSIGIRYKPWLKYNIYLSAQKLFKQKGLTRNDIFLRASAGFFDGYEYKFSEDSYFFHSLYLDIGYYLEEKSTISFANYDIGQVFKISKQFALLPYLTTGASYSNDNDTKTDVSRFDVGIGISLLNWLYEKEYEPYQFASRLKLEARGAYAGNAKDTSTIRLQFELFY